MRKYKNTLQQGAVRYIIFKEDNVWYAVGLEFNIVEAGDTAGEATLLLFEALAGYLEMARKIKTRPGVLNQQSDKEYEEMWRRRQEEKFIKAKNIFSFGELNVGQIKSQALVPA